MTKLNLFIKNCKENVHEHHLFSIYTKETWLLLNNIAEYYEHGRLNSDYFKHIVWEECENCNNENEDKGKLGKECEECEECEGTGIVELENDFNEYEVECKSCDGDGNSNIDFLSTKICKTCFGEKITPKHLYDGFGYVNPLLQDILVYLSKFDNAFIYKKKQFKDVYWYSDTVISDNFVVIFRDLRDV